MKIIEINKISTTSLIGCIIIGLFACSISLKAQSDLQDVVYAKNGSIVRGIIIEQIPNESITIKTADGNLFVYKIDEIEKMTKEPSIVPSDQKQKGKAAEINNESKNLRTSITPYFSFGITAAIPSMEDLNYSDPDLYQRDVNPLSIGGGIQVLFPVKGMKLGVDLGIKKTFKSTADYTMDLISSTSFSQQIDEEWATNILLLIEHPINDGIFVQGGLGAYLNSWFYSYEYYNTYYGSSYQYIEDSGTNFNFGIMLAGGNVFKISENIFIPLYIKFDFMFRYGIMIPITVNSGVRIAL